MKNNKISVINIILFPVYIMAIFLIWTYKFAISPLLPQTCKFYPTCSSYMLIAIKRFGIFKGVYLGTKRILRCNSLNKKCGYDPVPDNIKGDYKWLI